MTEFILFLFGAAIAIIGAGVMLGSKNAVHSALGLVVTMGALAFLFLLLDAPFLAMIQITVYAGAIMVLFIFVIMLLGAELLNFREPFRLLPVLGVVLSALLFFVIGLPLITTQLNANTPPPGQPQLRVVHAAPDILPITVALNDQVIADDVGFQSASSFVEVAPGDYNLTITPEGGSPITTTISLPAGTTQTLIAYGEGEQPVFAVVEDDLSTVAESRSSRIVVFNAYQPDTPVSLVDFGSDFDNNDTTTFVSDLAYGEVSEPVIVEEGSYDWSFVPGAGASDVNPGQDNVLFRNREYELDRDQSELVVLTADRQFDDTLRAAAVPVAVEARPAFGSPRAIGILLFTDYMLPFQLLAILLLAAMVGVIVLTRHHIPPVKQRDNVRRRVSRPLTNVIASQVGHEVAEDAPQLPAGVADRTEES